MVTKVRHFSELVSDIYDCALDPSGWEPTLTRINDALTAAYTSISVAEPGLGSHTLVVNSPWDRGWMTTLFRDFNPLDIPGVKETMAGDVDSPGSTLSVITEPEFQLSRFYRDWVGPQGLRDGGVMKFAHTPDRVGTLAVVTRANRDIISADEREFMALLSPHLRRAALIGDLLQNKQVETQMYRRALDRLTVAVYLVDANSRILYNNEAAETLLTQADHFSASAGILAARNPVTAAPLAEAIQRAARPTVDDELGRRGIGVPVSLGSTPAALAYVLPLNSGPVRAALQPAAVAVFVSTSRIMPSELETVFSTLFDLTPAEARLMLKIGSGMTIPAAALELAVTESTVKTHLNRIFRKTEITRQTDLVALVASLRPPVA
jgi:DNA-binding CsgD family transcriptional regulator/PAS domain-containing protein